VLALHSRPALSLESPEKSENGSSSKKDRLRVSFLKQMEEGGTKLNLGLAYWIELNRQGHLYRTSNFAKFQSGDQIRFHVLPNTDGFVYIVMHKGTTGTKSVLFPPPDSGINNFVKRGSECVVPREGSLEFDQVPGTEQVGLLLSRAKIDPVAYLSAATAQSEQSSQASPVAKPLTKDATAEAANDTSDLEKSFDAIFAQSGPATGKAAKRNGSASSLVASQGTVIESGNPGALEVLVSERGALAPEEPRSVLSSPSTALVVNDDPDAVVLVDFGLRHD